MSFSWLGTFRQGQWQSFRKFILEERRDVSERIAVIEAELSRIGSVEMHYASTTDAEGVVSVTEERLGFSVTPGSSLGKLVQAYVAMGGSPLDISLFLSPDTVVVVDTDVTTQMQPHGGVVSPESGSYAPGQTYTGGYLSIKKYLPRRVGGRKDLEDSQMASRVDAGRKWVRKEIRHKLEDIEGRIIKLMDLREQLHEELDDITLAAAGIDMSMPSLDGDRFDSELSVAQVVAAVDSIFYVVDVNGKPDFTQVNEDRLAVYPHLLDDDPEEANTNL